MSPVSPHWGEGPEAGEGAPAAKAAPGTFPGQAVSITPAHPSHPVETERELQPPYRPGPLSCLRPECAKQAPTGRPRHTCHAQATMCWERRAPWSRSNSGAFPLGRAWVLKTTSQTPRPVVRLRGSGGVLARRWLSSGRHVPTRQHEDRGKKCRSDSSGPQMLKHSRDGLMYRRAGADENGPELDTGAPDTFYNWRVHGGGNASTNPARMTSATPKSTFHNHSESHLPGAPPDLERQGSTPPGAAAPHFMAAGHRAPKQPPTVTPGPSWPNCQRITWSPGQRASRRRHTAPPSA